MRTYRSHKLVQAAKVTAEGLAPSGAVLWALDDGTARLPSLELRGRVPRGSCPEGGYLVEYADGFQSWSPARAFEEGYTEVSVADVDL